MSELSKLSRRNFLKIAVGTAVFAALRPDEATAQFLQQPEVEKQEQARLTFMEALYSQDYLERLKESRPCYCQLQPSPDNFVRLALFKQDPEEFGFDLSSLDNLNGQILGSEITGLNVDFKPNSLDIQLTQEDGVEKATFWLEPQHIQLEGRGGTVRIRVGQATFNPQSNHWEMKQNYCSALKDLKIAGISTRIQFNTETFSATDLNSVYAATQINGSKIPPASEGTFSLLEAANIPEAGLSSVDYEEVINSAQVDSLSSLELSGGVCNIGKDMSEVVWAAKEGSEYKPTIVAQYLHEQGLVQNPNTNKTTEAALYYEPENPDLTVDFRLQMPNETPLYIRSNIALIINSEKTIKSDKPTPLVNKPYLQSASATVINLTLQTEPVAEEEIQAINTKWDRITQIELPGSPDFEKVWNQLNTLLDTYFYYKTGKKGFQAEVDDPIWDYGEEFSDFKVKEYIRDSITTISTFLKHPLLVEYLNLLEETIPTEHLAGVPEGGENSILITDLLKNSAELLTNNEDSLNELADNLPLGRMPVDFCWGVSNTLSQIQRMQTDDMDAFRQEMVEFGEIDLIRTSLKHVVDTMELIKRVCAGTTTHFLEEEGAIMVQNYFTLAKFLSKDVREKCHSEILNRELFSPPTETAKLAIHFKNNQAPLILEGQSFQQDLEEKKKLEPGTDEVKTLNLSSFRVIELIEETETKRYYLPHSSLSLEQSLSSDDIKQVYLQLPNGQLLVAPKEYVYNSETKRLEQDWERNDIEKYYQRITETSPYGIIHQEEVDNLAKDHSLFLKTYSSFRNMDLRVLPVPCSVPIEVFVKKGNKSNEVREILP